jgi:hypothetical protein
MGFNSAFKGLRNFIKIYPEVKLVFADVNLQENGRAERFTWEFHKDS